MDDKLKREFEEFMEASRIKREQRLIKYPADLPNECGHHAFIKGIGIENSFNPSVLEYNILFETEYEKVYVWTHSENMNSCLISDIDISVKEKNFWKNSGSLINLALAYNDAYGWVDFESNFEYILMYYFSPTEAVDNIIISGGTRFGSTYMFSGTILKATDIANLASLMELMIRDDKCYTAMSLMFSSFQLHNCCLICELGLSEVSRCESHEPEIWEHADIITSMESAIVQACRCAESILGEPPSQKKQGRILVHKKKWLELVNIDPDKQYERSGMTYWEFYINLFDSLRNPSAHSNGDIHFDLERKHTIDAQCFSALILREYIKNNKKDFEEAMDILKFNRGFLSRVLLNMSTSLTKDGDSE